MTLPPPTTDTPDVDPVQNGADLQLLFTAMPAGSELSDKKAKSGDEISPYGCFLNAYHPGESEPYRYWSVYLHYPEPIAEEAGDRKASYKYRLKDSSDKVYLLANCVIPATQNAANLVDRLLRESLSEYESSSTVAKSNLAPQPVNTSDDRCSQPNDEGFSCKEGFCWLNDEMNSCCGFNPLGKYECGLPELEEVAEIEDCLGDDCGGGSGLPWPIPPAPPEDPSDPNPWEPIIPGGSSGPCETCDPGEDPDDDEQTCPLGQIDDGFGNCIDEEGDPQPCETDDEVISDPAIQEAFGDLWQSSNFGAADNPNPESERIEKGGFIVPGPGGGYNFQPLPSHLINAEETGPCQIGFSIPSNLPPGAIYVHTHPYSNGETQRYCNSPRPIEYRNEVGVKDRPALDKMGIDRGIIIDADKIISYTPNESEEPTLIDRCGY